MRWKQEIDPRLAQLLSMLSQQPARDPALAAKGRAAFLTEAQQLAGSHLASVSANEKARHIRWISNFSLFFQSRKERSPMFSTIGTIVLILSLILGGGGVTVAAAQSSLPDDGLYPVKVWTEQLREQATTREHSRLELALQLADRRAGEMQALLRAGQNLPAELPVRHQAQLDLALRLAAGLPADQAQAALLQIQQRLQTQLQAFQQLGGPANAQAVQLQTMLQERLQLCAQGLQEPAQLREQLNQGGSNPGEPGPNGSETGSNNGAGPGPRDENPNPWTDGTQTPGSGYGPGPGSGDCDTCTPQGPAGQGSPDPQSTPGAGPGDCTPNPSDGQNNPWTDQQPTPGESGPGPDDGSGTGPQSTPSGSGSGEGTNGGNGESGGSGGGK